MKVKVSKKKDHVIHAILSILVVILFAAVYLQGRQFSKFTEGLGEKSRTEIKAGSGSLDKSVPQDDEDIYQREIEKLETRIVEMQKLQDHLEDALNKYEEKDDYAASNRPEMDAVTKAKEDSYSRRNFLKQHRDFLEQNNYPPELSDKLFDLFIERHFALDEFKTNARKAGLVDANESDRRIDEINAEYDEKTAELLSEDGLALLKEYEKRWMERSMVSDFKDMLGADTLEKEKERELIELMYKRRQVYIQDDPFDAFPESGPLRKTLDAYVESAEAILSESQTVKFKAFMNHLKKIAVSDNTAENNSEKE